MLVGGVPLLPALLPMFPDLTNAAITAFVIVLMDEVAVRSALGTLMVVGASVIVCIAVKYSCWASRSSTLASIAANLSHASSSVCFAMCFLRESVYMVLRVLV